MEIRFELLPLSNYYTAPEHPHATDAVVYTALMFFKSNFLWEVFEQNSDIDQEWKAQMEDSKRINWWLTRNIRYTKYMNTGFMFKIGVGEMHNKNWI